MDYVRRRWEKVEEKLNWSELSCSVLWLRRCFFFFFDSVQWDVCVCSGWYTQASVQCWKKDRISAENSACSGWTFPEILSFFSFTLSVVQAGWALLQWARLHSKKLGNFFFFPISFLTAWAGACCGWVSLAKGSICLHCLLCLGGLLYPCDNFSFFDRIYFYGWKSCVVTGGPSAALYLALCRVREKQNFSTLSFFHGFCGQQS